MIKDLRMNKFMAVDMKPIMNMMDVMDENQVANRLKGHQNNIRSLKNMMNR